MTRDLIETKGTCPAYGLSYEEGKAVIERFDAYVKAIEKKNEDGEG